jgi:hypothetical protein
MLCHRSLEESFAASGARDLEFSPVLRAGVGVQIDQQKIIEKKHTDSSYHGEPKPTAPSRWSTDQLFRGVTAGHPGDCRANSDSFL